MTPWIVLHQITGHKMNDIHISFDQAPMTRLDTYSKIQDFAKLKNVHYNFWGSYYLVLRVDPTQNRIDFLKSWENCQISQWQIQMKQLAVGW